MNMQRVALRGAAMGIIALALFQGVIGAFDMPVRQSFVIQMVDHRDDLGNAIALNGTMVNSASLVGPAIAGAVIAAVGEGYCFLIDGISYIAVVMSLLAMRVTVPQVRRPPRKVLIELHEGWRYVRESLPIRSPAVCSSGKTSFRCWIAP